MGFFERIKKIGRTVRGLFSRKINIQRAFPEVNIVLSPDMETAIQNWTDLYEERPPWKGEIPKSMNTPVGVAREFARLSTMELKADVKGDSAMAKYLSEQFEKVVDHADTYVEYACAKGGVMLKPYVVPATGNIEVSIAHAEDFYITHYEDNGRILGAIFPDQKIINGKKYTRLERHELSGNTYTIENKVFVTDVTVTQSQGDEIIGKECSIDSVPDWAGIEPFVTINNIDQPLFAYLKMPSANNIDKNSPLGVSVYAKAVDKFRDVDEQYSRILWEYRATEASVFADEDILPTDMNGNLSLDKTEERLYRKLEGFEKQMELYNPDIRSDPLFTGLDKMLKSVEFLCEMAYGTLSDPQVVDKTAEEIKASKQRSYSKVAQIQSAIKNAHDDLIYAMYVLAVLYKLAPNGKYELLQDFGDSVNTDKETEFKRRMQLVSANLLKPELFMSWYFNCSVDEALRLMPEPIVEEEDKGPEEE